MQIHYQSNLSFNARISTPKNLTPIIKEKILSDDISKHFVPTPTEIIDLILKKIGRIGKDERILEPSAGYGHIVDRIIAKKKVAPEQIDVFEPVQELRQVLAGKHVKLRGKDILKCKSKNKYDKVIMNPPFDNGLDILHTLKCFSMLKPGGKLAVVLPESAFIPKAQQGAEKWRKDWLGDGRIREINEYLQDLIASKDATAKTYDLGDAFLKSDVPDDVKTRLLVLKKRK